MSLPKFTRSTAGLISQHYILALGDLISKFKKERNKTKENRFKDAMTYLEVGAFDGLNQSNTLILKQKLGWKGILVEPIDEYYQLLKKNRTGDICVNVLLSSEENKKYYMEKNGAMSKVTKKFIFQNYIRQLFYCQNSKGQFVVSTTINQLCSKYHIAQLDFISCDVEGMEHEVLAGVDLDALDVTAVLVECRPSNFMDITENLLKADFILVESMTRFNKFDNPFWDGLHQDYLFLKKEFYLFANN